LRFLHVVWWSQKYRVVQILLGFFFCRLKLCSLQLHLLLLNDFIHFFLIIIPNYFLQNISYLFFLSLLISTWNFHIQLLPLFQCFHSQKQMLKFHFLRRKLRFHLKGFPLSQIILQAERLLLANGTYLCSRTHCLNHLLYLNFLLLNKVLIILSLNLFQKIV